jgi:anti-sigma B factor antagonist
MTISEADHGGARMTIQSAAGSLHVGLVGEIDLANSSAIGAQLAHVHDASHDRVVFDFGQLEYIDSAGLAMLVDMVRRMRRSRSEVESVALPGTTARRLIDLTGLGDLLGVTDPVIP